MSAGILDFEIQKYLPLLGNEEKTTILSVIKSFLGNSEENVASIDIAAYNKEIDEAMTRINNGEFTSQEDLEKEMESW